MHSTETLTLEVAAEMGIHFYTPSGRHQSLLQPGSERREHAVFVQDLRDQGQTMNQIVEATGFSKPKCRRLLNELALTVAVEDGDVTVGEALTDAA